MASVDSLKVAGAVGFGGKIVGGFHVHPSKTGAVYPVGTTIVIRDLQNDGSLGSKQRFLLGHKNKISCVSMSPDGKFIASAETTALGFVADIILWDYASGDELHRFSLHKTSVQAISFSPSTKYLVSLGDADDNGLVLWDLEKGKAVCGAKASRERDGAAFTCEFTNKSDTKFITAGHETLRVWNLDEGTNKITPTDVQAGKLKRRFVTICVEADDSGMYCGSSSGDVAHFSLASNLFRSAGPAKDPLPGAVQAIHILPNGDLMVGSSGNTVALLKKKSLRVAASAVISGGVTSIRSGPKNAFVATALANLYCVDTTSLKADLALSCHPEAINDIKFPPNFANLFVSCGGPDIRVWNRQTVSELLRIQIPNIVCNCVSVMPNGKAIVSGWSDDKIRAFAPQSGKLLYTIQDAHHKGVTAITLTSDNQNIVSGGGDGQVRVWKLLSTSQVLVASLKEHKGKVTAVHLTRDDRECVTSSSDGSCITWDMERHVRLHAMFEHTFFKSVRYHPDEGQVVTVGTDKHVSYWDVCSGSLIRSVEGSSTEVTSIDMMSHGDQFVTAGGDSLVKVWSYDEANIMGVGAGHSGNITALAVSPDDSIIVSASDEGAIFLWEV